MSKGWYVKVETQIVVNIDTNVGVVASCEREAGLRAQEIVSKDLDNNKVVPDYLEQLSEQIPWEFDLGGMHWCRSGSPDIDFDTMQALSITPDPDFDPEDDDGPVSDIQGLMEAAQCLNEAFHDLPKDHPLNVWRETYGIAEVRDKLNSLAVYCDQTYRIMVDEQGYDLCFDWDFVPKFLENCVEDDFSVKSKNPRVLSMFWSGI